MNCSGKRYRWNFWQPPLARWTQQLGGSAVSFKLRQRSSEFASTGGPQREPNGPAALRSGGTTMQALTLMIVYVLTTASVQFLGFLVSKVIDYKFPTFGLMTFLILFMGAFGIAWPIAVRLTEWLIRSRGYVVETKQSGRA